MEKIKFQTSVSQYNLEEVKYSMTLDELRDMEYKMNCIIGNMYGFKDIKDRYLAEQMFIKGYLAASTERMDETTQGDQKR